MTRRLVDAEAASLLLSVRPATLRQWKRRGLVITHGTDAQGRQLYDINELQQLSDLRRNEHAS